MLRAIVVDDNNRDRRVIQEVIDWKALGVTIVGAASNGQEALELTRAHIPEIVVTDISMPAISGIELAKAINIEYPNTRIVFMSCYDDFKYAKAAISLNISGYVLKPIVPEELIEVVTQACEEYRRERELSNERVTLRQQLEQSLPILREEFFRELLHEELPDEEELRNKSELLKIEGGALPFIQAMTLSFVTKPVLSIESGLAEQYAIACFIKETVQALCTPLSILYSFRNTPSEYAVLSFSSENNLMEKAIDLYTQISDKFDLNPTIGMSNTSGRLCDISVLYRQSQAALKTKFYSSGNPIIVYADIEEKTTTHFEQTIKVDELYNEIKELIWSEELSSIERFLDKHLDCGFPSESYSSAFAISVVNYLHILLLENHLSFNDLFGNGNLVYEKLSRFDTILNLKNWLRNIILSCVSLLNSRNNSRDVKLVNEIKDIIHSRYAEQITIIDISESVYLSSKQANHIFKRETGMTIFDYLVEYRINLAKELLKDPCSRIYLVAAQVGYSNKSHFALMFKKLTGMSPTEFRS